MKITIEVDTPEQLREIFEKINRPAPVTFPGWTPARPWPLQPNTQPWGTGQTYPSPKYPGLVYL